MKRPAVTILIFATLFCSLTLFHAGTIPAAGKVVVIPLNSCKDSNLLPENICLGVTLCGVNGRGYCSEPPTVTSGGGLIWMDRNLGASQVATSLTDTLAYGDLYQWGRLADGHESRTSATTSTNSSTDVPGHSSFILETVDPWDWRIPKNDNLWQGVSGTNNPCPAGFRLPTELEWQAEFVSWGVGNNNAAGAFASPLKLVVAGYRYHDNGTIYYAGSYGYYWSATVNGTESRYLTFYGSNAGMISSHRAYGFTVRCLKD